MATVFPDTLLSALAILAAIIPTAGVAFALHWCTRIIRESRRAKFEDLSGSQPAFGGGIIGLLGRAETAIREEQDGRVFVRGELWAARSAAQVESGHTVKIVGVDGLKLIVERRPSAN